MVFQSKLPEVGTSIFTVMSALASEYNAVNLGQGFPDYPMDTALTELVNKAMQDGYNQYTPMQGYFPLREAIASKVEYLYQRSVDAATEITITPGGTCAIYTALTAILNPGDEVIIFQPCYDSYVPNVVVNGAIPVYSNLRFPDYSIDWDDVRNKITHNTKAILINSPHNPTGAVINKGDIHQLSEIVRDTNIFIISDEVYEHLIFDGLPHESILKYPELFKRSFVCFSFGKVFHCTGWKLGYCIAPAALTTEFRKIYQFNCFSCHTPSQVAIAIYLNEHKTYLDLGAFLQHKRDSFIASLHGSGFDLLSTSGSYFVCAKYNRLSSEGDKDFATRLTKEYGVATIPVSAFYHDNTDNKVIRFCFAKKDETILKAAEKLRNVRYAGKSSAQQNN